jgi:dinuclear metal center YbgI/SA1388 family protein
MILVKQIIEELHRNAPFPLQESYDNSGLLVGNASDEVRGVMLSLDCTETVIADAIKKGCNVVLSHHPIVFKGLKSLTGKTYVERTVMMAIRHNINLIACHTNADNVSTGVNKMIADRLGLVNQKILAPKSGLLRKITTFVPKDFSEKVRNTLYAAGAGHIGNYSHCSFTLSGTGTFLPEEGANPNLGSVGQLEQVEEHRVELVFPAHLESQIMAALRESHPYEEIAFDVQTIENAWQETGSGLIGDLARPMATDFFLERLKEKMNAGVVKHTHIHKSSVQRIAVCGGTGIFLLPHAIRANADVFVTADVKYHEFFDAEGQILLADIGHYESEQFTVFLFRDWLSAKFPNIALHFTEISTNPVLYY